MEPAAAPPVARNSPCVEVALSGPATANTGVYGWTLARVGSTTHALHAMNALNSYHSVVGAPIDPKVPLGVMRYMESWQLATGDVAAPVTNVSEAPVPVDFSGYNPVAQESREHWAASLRHTATALASICFAGRLLRDFPLKEDVRELDPYTIASCVGRLHDMAGLGLQRLAELARPMRANILTREGEWPKFVYSPAYVLYGLHFGMEFFGGRLGERDRKDVLLFCQFLAEHIATGSRGPGEQFLCELRHPNACYFFTLLVLDLALAPFTGEGSSKIPHCESLRLLAEDLVGRLAVVVDKGGFLPLGPAGKGVNAPPDPGTTARFVLVCNRLGNWPGMKLDDYAAEMAKRARGNLIRMFQENRWVDGSMTHTYEVATRLVELVAPSDREVFAERCRNERLQTKAQTAAERAFNGFGLVDDISRRRLAERLLDDPQLRSLAARDLAPEDLDPVLFLARYPTSTALHAFLERSFDEVPIETFKKFLERNRIAYRGSFGKHEMLSEILIEFGFEGPPITETTAPMFRQVGDIELAIRTLVGGWVNQETIRREDVVKVVSTGHRTRLPPNASMEQVWRQATFGDYWAMLKKGWPQIEPYLRSYVPRGEDPKTWGRIVFSELRDIRNRLSHLYPVAVPAQHIEHDRKFLEREGAGVLRALRGAARGLRGRDC